ncbi:Histone family protein nucleoid-structuring protein H-NS [Paraburkholderia caribensis]|uniref:H-NS histone family protein n=1 Tax=Paraburkholderia caribensis TaxID=75105 RepID=UPI001CB60949|nr:H-NS histone family protein [Paraburkholderia caribensis]CAG9233097.1 Histone family protein nucleoid-structuring protein H-NS [Paraburkholderia caribensis]
MATLESLQAKIAKLQAQAEAIAKKESSAVIARIRDIMEKHGLTSADIEAHIGGGKKRGRKPGVKLAVKSVGVAKTKSATSAKGKLPPKYRDPKSGATWSGHARPPQWIAGVKDRAKFLIDSSSAVSAPAAKKPAAKAGAYVRGPQPAKYRNPKTGATWSGRGPAPAWLAGTNDRTKFLIAGTGTDTAVAKSAVAVTKAQATKTATKKVAAKQSGVAAKKVSAKKVAAKKVVVKNVAKKAMSEKTSATKKAPAKKTTAKKAVPAASKKASTNKVSMTEAAVTAPTATVESGDGSTT